MAYLKEKTILILSPQEWGMMFISKHHYAIELAKRGNKVFFLNPPKTAKKDVISIMTSSVHGNLLLIEHSISFPYQLKFHSIKLFHWLMKFHVQKVIRGISPNIDVIWSFDLGNLYPFGFFSQDTFRIFHPVDEPLTQTAINSSKGADIIFSVTREILDKYHVDTIPKYVINHGVADEFLLPVNVNRIASNPVHIGFSGNLLRNDIDRPVILEIVDQNPQVVFDFWGNYKIGLSNLGGNEDNDTVQFIGRLQTKRNVKLHGILPVSQLASAIHAVDGFLICYDIQKDQSKGTNYHKIMEYLSTGKVIVSNNVSAYQALPELVQMTNSRTNNSQLVSLFHKVICNLEEYNSPDLQRKRIAFAQENLYSKQIDRIELLMMSNQKLLDK